MKTYRAHVPTYHGAPAGTSTTIGNITATDEEVRPNTNVRPPIVRDDNTVFVNPATLPNTTEVRHEEQDTEMRATGVFQNADITVKNSLEIGAPSTISFEGVVLENQSDNGFIRVSNFIAGEIKIVTLNENTRVYAGTKEMRPADLRYADVVVVTGTTYPYSTKVAAESIVFTRVFTPNFSVKN